MRCPLWSCQAGQGFLLRGQMLLIGGLAAGVAYLVAKLVGG